ncbi:YwqG family protein [Lysinibacillus sp. 54212]|uniref:YwqG family protein n=1 Tax=Lysinibacillus sp. 54212 TaxID=3119829 RepID=UPI002FC9603E
MNIPMSISVPKQLECFSIQLHNSALSYSRLRPSRQKPSIMNSKFAGFPYLPKGAAYPKDVHGQFMLLLAQINLAEANLPQPFPAVGMLQFFISETCYEHGQFTKGHRQQYHFKVCYYPFLVPEQSTQSDFFFLHDVSRHAFPIQQEVGLTFSQHVEPVSATDYRLHYFVTPYLQEQFSNEYGQYFEDIYFQHFSAADHKIGGYPYFIGKDERVYSSALQQYDTLLLQIVSNDEQGIMWGDCGVIKFLINEKKLSQGDFSDVYFYIENY